MVYYILLLYLIEEKIISNKYVFKIIINFVNIFIIIKRLTIINFFNE